MSASRRIDHGAGHPAIDDQVVAGDESSLVVGQEAHGGDDVVRFADPPDGMLGPIDRAMVRDAPMGRLLERTGLDPAGTDGIDPDLRSQTDRSGVGVFGMVDRTPVSVRDSGCPPLRSATGRRGYTRPELSNGPQP